MLNKPDHPAFVAYIRVSTDKQGRSGLGLEAQQEAVTGYITRAGGGAFRTYVEVESGKNDDRPQLAAAMAECRALGATLVIAKLDRLSRNVHFLSGLMSAGVEFVCCDMPTANKLTLHIMAAFAEHEREMISRRTREAMAVAKARGVKFGSSRLSPGTAQTAARACQARQAKAAAKASDVLPYIPAAKRAGCETLAQIGEALEARGVRTPRGNSRWAPAQVARVMAKA